MLLFDDPAGGEEDYRPLPLTLVAGGHRGPGEFGGDDGEVGAGSEELGGAQDAVEARQTLAAVPPTMSRRENSSMRQGVSLSRPNLGSPGPSCQISFGS